MDQTERRQYVRYRPTCNTIVQYNLQVGQITDISEGGLAFRYLNWEERCGNPPKNEQESVSLLLSGSGIFLKNIPCRTVFDKLLPNDSFLENFFPRQRHLAFTEMSDDQRSTLADFITLIR